MVNVFNIIVTSAMLVLGNDVNNPVPYCTVQIQQQEQGQPVQQPRPEYDLFEDPDGGCKELGARILEAVQEQEPNAAVTLTVDGVSVNDI
ncbi:hypothetical protein NEBGPKAL_00052 [Klebsiella phage vB_KpP-Screen]|nr:hypothetical protein HIIECEMK_00005 [Klebsiella phage vB_KqP-Goliath]CAD5239111.1 hypothetical protein NEBGPKAL_00052 [Klebsiella phage vB_KpP-Screen]CAD5239348.1 hypothetical protein BLCJPOBP_00004 [Klebsiella phage vB_KpP-Yoda]